jgi:hypothetical protein
MQMPQSISKAFDLVMWIEGVLHDLSLPSSDRTRIAGACFAAALEHHHAVVVLFRERLNGSAFALMRSAYEAYVRGVWLARCATDMQLSSFIDGVEPPKLDVMLYAIEKIPTYEGKTLSSVKVANWKSMCSYTHTGALQVQRWNTSEAITSRHSPEEIEEVLGFTNGFALLSALGVAMLAENESLAAQLLDKSRKDAK